MRRDRSSPALGSVHSGPDLGTPERISLPADRQGTFENLQALQERVMMAAVESNVMLALSLDREYRHRQAASQTEAVAGAPGQSLHR